MEKTKQPRGPSQRAQRIASRSIEVTASDPMEALRQLCRSGVYRWHFTFDKFVNGIMCQCELFYFMEPDPSSGRKKSNRRSLLTEATFVQGATHPNQAKRTVAELILNRLGFGVPENPREEMAEDVIRSGIKVVSNLMQEAVNETTPASDYPSGDPSPDPSEISTAKPRYDPNVSWADMVDDSTLS